MQNSFKLKGAGWPGWRDCGDNWWLSGSGSEGQADGTGRKADNSSKGRARRDPGLGGEARTEPAEASLRLHGSLGFDVTDGVERGRRADVMWGGTGPNAIQLHSGH